MVRASYVAALAVGLVCYALGRLHGAMLAPATVADGTSQTTLDNELAALKVELKSVRANLRNNAASARPCNGEAKNTGSVTPEGKEVREIVSLNSGLCMDFNALQNGDLLATWACHKGAGRSLVVDCGRRGRPVSVLSLDELWTNCNR